MFAGAAEESSRVKVVSAMVTFLNAFAETFAGNRKDDEYGI